MRLCITIRSRGPDDLAVHRPRARLLRGRHDRCDREEPNRGKRAVHVHGGRILTLKAQVKRRARRDRRDQRVRLARGRSLVDNSHWPEGLRGCAQAFVTRATGVQRTDAPMQRLCGSP